MDKTVKVRAYPDDAKSNVPRSNLTEDQDKMVELVKKNALLEEENKKSREYLNTIEQLKESLKQEQVKTAEMAAKTAKLEAKVNDLAALEANDLAMKNAQIEEEKKKSLEHLKTIEQLRESLKQEQAKTAEMVKKTAGLEAKINELSGLEDKVKAVAELEAKVKELPALEAKVKELTDILGKISGIAATGKAG
ncbi:MAG: hypothetical protein PHD65_08270 [Gallionella sp.]|nr:hypothetical protein [Gallionella sp.]